MLSVRKVDVTVDDKRRRAAENRRRRGSELQAARMISCTDSLANSAGGRRGRGGRSQTEVSCSKQNRSRTRLKKWRKIKTKKRSEKDRTLKPVLKYDSRDFSTNLRKVSCRRDIGNARC